MHPASRYSVMLLFIITGPVRNVPAGKYMVPPPSDSKAVDYTINNSSTFYFSGIDQRPNASTLVHSFRAKALNTTNSRIKVTTDFFITRLVILIEITLVSLKVSVDELSDFGRQIDPKLSDYSKFDHILG